MMFVYIQPVTQRNRMPVGQQSTAERMVLKPHIRTITLIILLFLSNSVVCAQKKSDSLNVKLSEITVTATPFGLAQKNSSLAFTQVKRSNLEVQTTPALSLDRLTTTVPGLWINNRENYALGERITLRGLGWSSAFGVRGIQIFLDGIPLTGADGQSVLTVVDPAFIRDIRLIRGPSSAFWGNSSGGILYLSTFPDSQVKPFVRLRETVGSYGLS
ncbi:MAG TPA: TonB-dependent receptor plug domain-containing protein, partial [Balneolales bacterium]|nr:TonB-dependent receptor plug domain-containing protein [Balneolales bacterium]